mgnify:CR=1 FL=1
MHENAARNRSQKYPVKANSAIAIVSTPLQFLNANELIERLNITHAVLLVASATKCVDVYKALPRSGNATTIRYLQVPRKPLSGIAGLAETVNRVREAKRIVKDQILTGEFNPQCVILGNLSDELHLYAANVLSNKVLYIVDDGAATLSTARTKKLLRERFVLAICALAGALVKPRSKTYLQEHSCIFSVFNIVGKVPGNLQNDFRWLRSCFDSVAEVDEIWVVGQYLVEAGIMSADDYKNAVISAIDEQGSNYKACYILHPREKYARHHKQLESYGVAVKSLGIPMEVYMLSNRQVPRRAITFYSSAFGTCSQLFDSSLPFTFIDARSKIHPAHCKHVIPVYEQLLDSVAGPHKIHCPYKREWNVHSEC